jgi:RHS repeat-associated protein
LDVDGMNLTYDALGRMVEENMGSNYDEFDFTPTGAKLAFMSGQTLVKAFVSLPGGAQAVYTSSGLAYYRHKDWLGSSRLASTPTRTTFSDTALAPYGEAYAQSGTTDLNFTGMNQDVASGVYDFPAREYGAVPGRWPSPDPAGLAAVNPGNPQSWNRYAYVQNDPLSFTDPQGLCQAIPLMGGTMMEYVGDDCGGGPNETCYLEDLSGEGGLTTVCYDFVAPAAGPGSGGGGGASRGSSAQQMPQQCIQSVFNPSCKPAKPPSCPAVFLQTTADQLMGDPTNPPGINSEDAAKAAAGTAAVRYIMKNSLSTPLRSSTVRSIQDIGEWASDMVALVPLAVAESNALWGTEYPAWKSGACSTIWTKP